MKHRSPTIASFRIRFSASGCDRRSEEQHMRRSVVRCVHSQPILDLQPERRFRQELEAPAHPSGATKQGVPIEKRRANVYAGDQIGLDQGERIGVTENARDGDTRCSTESERINAIRVGCAESLILKFKLRADATFEVVAADVKTTCDFAVWVVRDKQRGSGLRYGS